MTFGIFIRIHGQLVIKLEFKFMCLTLRLSALFFSHRSRCQSSSEEVRVDGDDDGNDDDGDDKNCGDTDDGGGDDGDGNDRTDDVLMIRVMKMVLMVLMVSITWS